MARKVKRPAPRRGRTRAEAPAMFEPPESITVPLVFFASALASTVAAGLGGHAPAGLQVEAVRYPPDMPPEYEGVGWAAVLARGAVYLREPGAKGGAGVTHTLTRSKLGRALATVAMRHPGLIATIMQGGDPTAGTVLVQYAVLGEVRYEG